MGKDVTEILAAANPDTNKAKILLQLEAAITHLLNEDPEKLIHVLYRIDVDEKKFTDVLQANTPTTAKDTALLMYDRALQKAAFKNNYNDPGETSSEEKW